MQANTTAEESQERIITMDKGSRFTAPADWKMKKFDNHLQMMIPEEEFSIYFIELANPVDIQKAVKKAWKSIQPVFNLAPLKEIFPIATDDWEKAYFAIYSDTNEPDIIMAMARIYAGYAYICLVQAKSATYASRSSELMLMYESWKPRGFTSAQLNQRSAKNWNECDVQEFEKFIAQGMREFQVPGLTIAIIHQDGKIPYKKAFGVKKWGEHDPVTLDTPFMIGSITKALTTFLMAKLIDAGKITWDTPLTHLLKDFSLADPALTQRLRIRDTVSASTGLPPRDISWILKFNNVKPEDRLAEMKSLSATTEFGKKFQYSNELVMTGGYAAACAYLSEGNLETAYAAAMQEFVFEPLQMKNTILKVEDALKRGAALPHAREFNGNLCAIPLELEGAVYSVAPAGAVWSTVEDLTHYLLAEMNNGILEERRVINENTLLERRKPGIRMSDTAYYGLGLVNYEVQGLNFVGHGGGTLGFSSHLFFIPEKGIGMVILSNAYAAHPFLQAIQQKFLELTFNAKVQAQTILESAIQERAEIVKKQQSTISLELKDFSERDKLLGEYYSDIVGNMKLIKSNDRYELEFDNWKTEVGSEEHAGKKNLVIVSPPWCGLFKLQFNTDQTQLNLDFFHEKYNFTRIK